MPDMIAQRYFNASGKISFDYLAGLVIALCYKQGKDTMTQETFAEMARRHRAAGMLEAGDFQMRDGKSCSIGCFCHDYGLEPSDFEGLAKKTKYPEAGHRLQEAIFEGLPETERADWHVAFAEKAETVTDWQRVIDKTVLASLRIAKPHDTSESKVVAIIIDLYERRLNGDNPSDAEWYDARAAAFAADAVGAAAGAARATARAAAWATAWATAQSAWAEGAADAAGSAAGAAWAAGAAGSAKWMQIRDAFLNA